MIRSRVGSRRLPAGERRVEILAAAKPVFGARGYHAATTRDLAAAADVSEALLYQHFPGKQQLFEAVVEICAAELEQRLCTSVTGADPLAQTLTTYFCFVEEEADLYRIFFRQALQEQAFGRLYRAYSSRLLELLLTALGAEPGPRSDVLGHAVAGMVSELALWWVEEGGPSRQEIVGQAVSMARAMHASEAGHGR